MPVTKQQIAAVVKALTYTIGVWSTNTVEARYDVDWDMTEQEEGELSEIIRTALRPLTAGAKNTASVKS